MITNQILIRRSTHALRKIRNRPEGVAFVAIVCDNCQRVVQAPTIAQLAPKLEGWHVDDQVGREIDYCPECLPRML